MYGRKSIIDNLMFRFDTATLHNSKTWLGNDTYGLEFPFFKKDWLMIILLELMLQNKPVLDSLTIFMKMLFCTIISEFITAGKQTRTTVVVPWVVDNRFRTYVHLLRIVNELNFMPLGEATLVVFLLRSLMYRFIKICLLLNILRISKFEGSTKTQEGIFFT